MHDPKFRDEIRAAARELRRLEDHGLAARNRLRDYMGLGYSGSSRGGRGSGISRPVERVALDDAAIAERDRYRGEYELMEDKVALARQLLRDARRIAHAALNVRAEAEGEEGCAVCERATLPQGHDCNAACAKRDHQHPDAYQKIYVRLDHDAGATPKVPYCSWHAEFIERYDVEPATTITLWHLDHLGARVPHSLIRDHHPDAFERHHGARRSA